MNDPQSLVSTDWLAERLDAPDVRAVDATWFMKASGRAGYEDYRARHIPGAVFFDIDDIADDSTALPHMLPSAEKFSSRVRKLGLGNGHQIVVYDGSGIASAACRVWWMFRYFGHKNIAVLDGGLPKWLREDRPVDDRLPMMGERHFMPRVNATLLRTLDQMKESIASGKSRILDARAAERFAGRAPEPWTVQKIGHMPGAINLPWMDVIDSASGTLLPPPALQALFAAKNIDDALPLIATCGSGVTACVIALALYRAGYQEAAIYDGSWAEWGARDDTPVI